MRKTSLVTAAVAAAVTAAAGLSATPALAAPTAVAPSVVLDPVFHYVVGDQLSDYTRYDLRWTAYSPYGICKQTVTYQDYDSISGPKDPVLGDGTSTVTVPKTSRSYRYQSDDIYDRVTPRAVVRVTDCHGTVTTSRISTLVFGSAVKDSAISYGARWRNVSKSPAYVGGSTHYTTAKGATATFNAPGGELGLVLDEGAARGQVDLYIDGAERTRIDTFASAATHRTIGYEELLAPGSHVVQLVNVGTAGRPRVDLDLVLTGPSS